MRSFDPFVLGARRFVGWRLPADDVPKGTGYVSATRSRRTAASKELLYRWLLQLKVAPYSFDLIDNFGKQSPRVASVSPEQVSVGDTFMTIFRLVDFVDGESVTLRMRDDTEWSRFFGDVILSYSVVDVRGEDVRYIVVRIWFGRIGHLASHARQVALVAGDKVMMAKQLATLCSLAEG